MLVAGGGAEASSVTRTRCAWKKFRELLPILSLHTFSLKKKGSFYQACVRPVLLYGSETRSVKEDLVRLHRIERSMLRWMSHATFKVRVPSKESGAGQTKLEEDYCDEQTNPCQHGILNDFKLMVTMVMTKKLNLVKL